jgi:hypothetical protein
MAETIEKIKYRYSKAEEISLKQKPLAFFPVSHKI